MSAQRLRRLFVAKTGLASVVGTRFVAVLGCITVWALCAASAGRAQTIDPNLWVANGEVDAVVRDGATIYLGGYFNSIGPATGGGVVVDQTSGALPGSFPKVAGRIYAAVPDGSGGWYIGGSFSAVGGLPRSNIARLASDLTVTSWNPGADNPVRAIAVGGSAIYVGGIFTNIGGQARSYIAAVDPTTGAATSWNPNADGPVYSLAVQGAEIYAGGSFLNIGGQPRSRIAKLNSGSNSADAWNPNSDDIVYSIVVSGAKVFVAGAFLNIGGHARSHIAALSTSNGSATAWNPNADYNVISLVQRGSVVYAGGYFNIIGGQFRSYLAAIDTSGSGAATAWAPEPNSLVLSVAEHNGIIYAGGLFLDVGGVPRKHVAAIDAVTGTPTSWNPNANHAVWAFAIDPAVSDKVFVGGQFTSIGTQWVTRYGIAALDASTGQVTAWNPVCDGAVLALKKVGAKIYAGGDFTNIGGQARNSVAALDSVSGNATAWDPSANGPVNVLAVRGTSILAGGNFTSIGGASRSRLAALDATSGLATAWDPSADGIVNALAVSGTTVYAGGTFANVGGAPRARLAAVDATSGLATAWDPGPNGPIYALALTGTTVYVGGNYSSIAGESRGGLAAIDAATGLASPWNPQFNSPVQAVAVADSTVYAGGQFFLVAGQPCNYLAAIDARTGSRTAWTPNPDAQIHALAASSSMVYAGGDFASMGAQPAGCFAGIRAAPDARSVQPASGGNSDAVTVTIMGYNLQAGATVRMSLAGQPDLVASMVVVAPDAHSLTATFDLTGAATGAWDVLVTNPDGQTATLANGFTITSIEAPQLTVSVVGPPLVRAGQRASYDLVIQNPGNIDALDVPLWITGLPLDVTLELDFALTAPPRTGGEPDWSSVPLSFTSPAGRYVPLVLPSVPPGTSVRRVFLTVPPNDPSLKLRAALTPPWADGNVFRGCLANGGITNPACMGSQLTALDTYLAGTSGLDAVSGIGVWAKIAWNCEGAGSLGAALVKAEQVLDFMVQPIDQPGSALSACSNVLPPRWRDSLLVTVVSSFDPNDKLGAQGTLAIGQAIPYSIRFENASTATAPAQQVVISDPLNVSKLDPGTVSLDVITFGSVHIVPPPGLNSYATQVDLRPTRNLLVNVSAGVDLFTGVLSWYFTSIDPATGQPPLDPLAGFLPPNNTQHDGEGSVLFTVMPRSGLASGAQISNAASITFDTNAPHATPTWLNTVDNTPPQSHVLPLPTNSDQSVVPVNWTPDGSTQDLRDYTVYVAEDGAPYRVWRLNTAAVTDTLAPPKDHKIHHYAFYSVARDVSGNIEPPPTAPDATTQSRTAVGDAVEPPRLALAGAQPNPAFGAMHVGFTLASSERATLELIDVAGRRVLRRDVGSLGPGPHSITLDAAPPRHPGLYFIRLVQGPHVLCSRVAVIQ